MKTYKIEIKWAFLFTAMFLIWMILERVAGLHDEHLAQQQYLTTLILIPSVILYVLALRDKKKNFYKGGITYKQGFISGLVLTLFVVLLSPINQLVTASIISPDYFNNLIDYTVRSGVFTREQAERQFNIKSYMVTSVIAGLITGIVFSAIISLFTRSKAK